MKGRDKRKIIFVFLLVSLLILLIGVASGKLVLENVRQLTFEDVHSTTPRWCPDGSIVYSTTNLVDEKDDAIYKIVNPTSANPEFIKLASFFSLVPSCGPNGEIVFAWNESGNESGIYHLYVMEGDGSNLHRVTNSPMEELEPSWSPDGKKIVFAGKTSGNKDIWVVDADGSNLTRLTDWPSAEGRPSWSPDGRKIVFVRGSDIWVMDADGSNKKRLPTDTIPRESDFPSWSKDGNKISYYSRPTGDQLERYPHLVGLWVFDLNMGEENLLIKFGMVSDWKEYNKIAFSSIVEGSKGKYYQIFIADVIEVSDFDSVSIFQGIGWILFVGIPLGLTLIYIAIIVRGKLRKKDDR
jgi:Tol biopolymer transport system component